MKSIRALFAIFGLLILSSDGYATYTLTYSTNGNVITLTGYTGAPINVTIPNFVSGVGNEAFIGCTSMTSVTIPNSVTTLGVAAFYGCYGLTNVSIPNSVTSLGTSVFFLCTNLSTVTISNGVTSIPVNAFYECYALTGVTIPNSVVSIGIGAFQSCTLLTNAIVGSGVASIGGGAFIYCSSLKSITVSAQNTSFSSVNGVLFDKNQDTLVEYPGGLSGAYTIPNSVNTIAAVAFKDCNYLTSVTIPDSVLTVGSGAFGSCIGLTNVIIGSGASNPLGFAFSGCSSLTSITVSAQNPYYSSLNGVLFNVNQTTLVEYPGGLSRSYTIPDTVTSIGPSAFQDCSSLTSVTIPNSVTSIGDGAFETCPSLTSVYFAGNAPSVPDSSVFSNGDGYDPTTAYYLNGTMGWSGFSTSAMIPVALLNPPISTTSGGFGIQSNRFGFAITGPTNIPIIVQARTNLANGAWTNIQSCNITNGSIFFSDPAWTNYPARFYRVSYAYP